MQRHGINETELESNDAQVVVLCNIATVPFGNEGSVFAYSHFLYFFAVVYAGGRVPIHLETG